MNGKDNNLGANNSDFTYKDPSIDPDQAVDTDLPKEIVEADELQHNMHNWWDSLLPDELGHDPKDFYKYFGLADDTLDSKLSFARLIKDGVVTSDPKMLVPEGHSGESIRRLHRILPGGEDKSPTLIEAFELGKLPNSVKFNAKWEDGKWNCSLISTVDDKKNDVSDLPYYQK